MKDWLNIFSTKKKGEDSPFSENSLREMIHAAESAVLSSKLVDLTGQASQAACEIAPRLHSLSPLLINRGASPVVSIGVLESSVVWAIRGRPDHLPLRSSSCQAVLCRPHFARREWMALLKEATRILQPDGILYLCDLHPFSPIVQEEYRKNPVTEGGVPPGSERYFKAFQANELVVRSVKESFFDMTFKKFFDEKGKAVFEKVRKHPFLILIELQRRY